MTLRTYMFRAGTVMLAVLLIVLGLLQWQARRMSDAAIARQHDAGLAAQNLVEQQQRADLDTRARLIVGNQAFVRYVSQAMGGALPGMEIDATSIVDLLEERRGQLDLDVVAVLNGQGSVVAGTSRFAADRQLGTEPLFQAARDSGQASDGLWLDDGRLRRIAILPLDATGFNDIFLLAGMPVGETMAREIGSIADAEVVMLAAGAQAPSIAASTLSPAEQAALVDALPVAGEDDGIALTLAGTRYRAVSAPLFDSDEGRLLVLARAGDSLAQRLPMLLGGVLALLATGLAAAWYWRQVQAPSTLLAGLLDRVSGGDYHLHAEDQGSDAVRRIAGAFNRLVPGLRERNPH